MVLSLAPAEAASGTKKGEVLMAGEWTGLSGTANGMGGVTPNALWAACRADRAALVAGQPATAVKEFINGPLNGVDAIVVDLGSNTIKAGVPISVSVTGPGSKILASVPTAKTPLESDIDVPNYDFDLSFLSGPSKVQKASAIPGSGCNDANPADFGTACYSHNPTADESTKCIEGDADGYGARFLIASLSLNIPVTKSNAPRPGPVPYTLTWSY